MYNLYRLGLLALTGYVCGMMPFLHTLSKADQAAFISRDSALVASQRLKLGDEVRLYCHPCGDQGYQAIVLEAIAIEPVPESDSVELHLNHKGVDLAYTYVRRKGSVWENLGLAMGLRVTDVPRFLPSGLSPLEGE
jgi:hypothetical protein